MEAEDSEKTGREIKIVLFDVHDRTFSMDIQQVRDIIRVPEITSIPNSKPFIRGVINLRGRIIVVVDAGKKIGLDHVEPKRQSRVIITEIEDDVVGMLVDSVSEVIRINTDDILPPPAAVKGTEQERYFKGVKIYGNKLVMVMDAGKLFTDEDYELN